MEINQLAQVINAIKDPALLTDQHGRITTFNDSALALAEGKPRKLAGKHILEVISLNELSGTGLDWLGSLNSLRGEAIFKFLNEVISGEISTSTIDGVTLIAIKDYSLEKRLHENFKLQLTELEKLNQNLEQEVALRTVDLKLKNDLLERIYGVIDETVILSDIQGRCLPHQPARSADFFGLKLLQNQRIQDLVFRDTKKADEFLMWLSLVANDTLPKGDLEELMNQELEVGEKIIDLSVKILESSTKIILFILKDRTESRRLQTSLKKYKEENRHLSSLLSDPQRARSKTEEWETLCSSIKFLIAHNEHKKALNKLHLLKGSLQLESFYEAYQQVHEIEQLGDNITSQEISDLECIILSKKRLLSGSNASMQLNTKLKSMIRDLSQILKLNCQNFELTINGDAELRDSIKQPLELIILQHFRNLLAHAFSNPEERSRELKDPNNQVIVDIDVNETHTILTITDDGMGLRSFHLKKETTHLSGMGRGLEAMKEEASRIGAKIDLNIKENGSELVIQIPQIP